MPGANQINERNADDFEGRQRNMGLSTLKR
jgi:hypothetical protein